MGRGVLRGGAWVIVKAGNDGKILVGPSALEAGHGDAGEGRGGGEFDVGILRHGEGDLDVLEHVFEREAGFEIAVDHAGHLHVDDRRAGGVVFEGVGEFVEGDAIAVQEGEGLGEGGDGGGRNEVCGDFQNGCLADGADLEDLAGADGELGAHAVEDVFRAADVVNEFSGRGGVAAAGEWGVEEGGVFLPDDGCGLACIDRRDGRVVQNDVLRREGRGHGAEGLQKGLAVGDEDLDVAGGFRDIKRGAEEIRLRAQGAAPCPDLVTRVAQAGGHAVADDAEPDDSRRAFLGLVRLHESAGR